MFLMYWYLLVYLFVFPKIMKKKYLRQIEEHSQLTLAQKEEAKQYLGHSEARREWAIFVASVILILLIW